MYGMIDDMQTGTNWKEDASAKSNNMRILYRREDGCRHNTGIVDCIIKAPLAECYSCFSLPQAMVDYAKDLKSLKIVYEHNKGAGCLIG